jgi:putative acetyltransferase
MASSPQIHLRIDDLRGDEVALLLQKHLEELKKKTPVGETYALDLEALRAPGILFWTALDGSNDLLGCGALKDIGGGLGEIKSMHTAERHRGKGVARTIVETILRAARERGYTRLLLETGSSQPFAPARSLYSSFGFSEVGPFNGYIDNGFSTFMALELNCNETQLNSS